MMRELLRRVAWLFRWRRHDADLIDELAFHREMVERHGGIPLGNVLRIREDAHDAWGFGWLEQLAQDVRYALRVLRGSPVFTVSAVTVLAVGIGATVAAFSAFSLIALRPLPVKDPDTLVRFSRQAEGRTTSEIPWGSVQQYGQRSRLLSAVLADVSTRVLLPDLQRTVHASYVTSNFFEELGARPRLGRLLAPSDDHSDVDVVVLSHRFWTTQFGAADNVVGQRLNVNGTAAIIIGVASRDFSGMGGLTPAFWGTLTARQPAASAPVRMSGRRAADATLPALENELATIATGLHREDPSLVWQGERLIPQPAGYGDIGDPAMFGIVVALAALILAAACGNLGTLLIAKGAARHREIALRLAIGAGPSRIRRQLFTESLVLAAIAGAAGLVVGWFVLRMVMVWTHAPEWMDPTPDWRTVAAAVLVAGGAAVVFGWLPARQVAAGTAGRASRSRSLLLAVQVASSCVLLVVSGLLVRAFDRAASSDPGYDAASVIVISPSLMDAGFDATASRDFVERLRARIAATPGIERVSITPTPPLSGATIMGLMPVGAATREVYLHHVDPAYFATMGIPLVAGRGLSADERRSVVVSESLAHALWPSQDPVGRTLAIGGASLDVVGMAASTRAARPADDGTLELYRLAGDGDFPMMSIVARTSRRPTEAMVQPLLELAREISPSVPAHVYPLREALDAHTADTRMTAVAVSVLGLVALAVACLGITGLVTFTLTLRARDIGIRKALGARAWQVASSVLGQFLPALVAGMGGGIGLAILIGQLLRSQLYGVSPVDPFALVGATVTFIGCVALAAVWPLRRLLRQDPLPSLRE